MALITCPECGRQVSNRAASCPSCGCPINAPEASKAIKIQLPNSDALGGQGLAMMFVSRDAFVSIKGKKVWTGMHGQLASFDLDGPAEVTVDLGFWANPTTGVVEPGHKYQLVQDLRPHMKATFVLSEVDVIDSGL